MAGKPTDTAARGAVLTAMDLTAMDGETRYVVRSKGGKAAFIHSLEMWEAKYQTRPLVAKVFSDNGGATVIEYPDGSLEQLSAVPF